MTECHELLKEAEQVTRESWNCLEVSRRVEKQDTVEDMLAAGKVTEGLVPLDIKAVCSTV